MFYLVSKKVKKMSSTLHDIIEYIKDTASDPDHQNTTSAYLIGPFSSFGKPFLLKYLAILYQ